MGLWEGRVAIVTGAAQGIGFAVAARIFAEGGRLILGDMQNEKLHAASRLLDTDGKRVMPFTLNVADGDSAYAMVNAGIEKFGRIDALVNVAGGSGSVIVEQIEDMKDEVWDSVISSNLRGTFICSRAVVPVMKHQGFGSIVNFATGSIRGFKGKSTSAGRLAYVSAKAGIIGFTNQLSQDLDGFNIAVNVIQPGFVLTEPGARIREIFESMPLEDQRAMLARRSPRTPEELGWATAVLASKSRSELTSTCVRLNGPIKSLNLRIVHDAEGILASTAKLEAA